MSDEIAFTRIPYKGRRSKMRLRIREDGTVLASAPVRVSDRELAQFVKSNGEWILKKMETLKTRKSRMTKLGEGTRDEYHSLKPKALKIANVLIERVNRIYNFKIRNVSIRNQRTRWGSCTSNGDIAFNYRIALLPDALAEYLVAHELCHIGEMNHSDDFWKLVERAIPDWKERRAQLHLYGLSEQ